MRRSLLIGLGIVTLCSPLSPLAASPVRQGVLALGGGARVAPVRRRPSVTVSIIAGAAMAMVPMAIGGAVLGSDDPDTRNLGAHIFLGGLTLAPLVSHGIVGEWRRGLAFAAVPALGQLGVLGVMWKDPKVTQWGLPRTRIPFGSFVCLSLLGSIVGLVDSVIAGDRLERRGVVVQPVIDGELTGLGVRGVF